MNAIIPDIDTLKTVVKINASLPEGAIDPFIDDAIDIYLEPQIGSKLVEKALAGTDKVLNKKILRCLGPLALMLASPEFGIRIGDSGFSVDNKQGTYSPASDSKIAAAKESLQFRGMQALDRLLTFLTANAETYPEYKEHCEVTTEAVPCFIRSAQDFQDKGMVNIEYSTISYRAMLPTIRQLQERNVREMLGDTLYDSLLKDYIAGNTNAKQTVLSSHVLRYLANQTAELYTSQTSREQRTTSDTPEFSPIIRPIYQDQAETGNFFGNQATYYAGKIHSFIIENAADLGITPKATAVNFNSKEKKLFTSIS